MEALFSYLSSEYGSAFAIGRFFAFLFGAPDYGAGQLDTRRYGKQYASKGEDADRALLTEQSAFCKELRVFVDICAVTYEYMDLGSLKFLSIESEGSLFLYQSTDDSTLPQDIQIVSNPKNQSTNGGTEGTITIYTENIELSLDHQREKKESYFSCVGDLQVWVTDHQEVDQCQKLRLLPLRVTFDLGDSRSNTCNFQKVLQFLVVKYTPMAHTLPKS